MKMPVINGIVFPQDYYMSLKGKFLHHETTGKRYLKYRFIEVTSLYNSENQHHSRIKLAFHKLYCHDQGKLQNSSKYPVRLTSFYRKRNFNFNSVFLKYSLLINI